MWISKVTLPHNALCLLPSTSPTNWPRSTQGLKHPLLMAAPITRDVATVSALRRLSLFFKSPELQLYERLLPGTSINIGVIPAEPLPDGSLLHKL